MSLSDTLSNTSNAKPEPAEPTVTVNPADQLTQSLVSEYMYFQDSMGKTQESEAQRRQKILMNKFALTGSMESDVVSENEDKTFSSEPFTSFYFCSGNALTIGYGVKIEYKDGELCKEGLEVLADLDIHRNGKSLSMDEKEALVKECFAKRAARDNAIKNGKKLKTLTNANGDEIKGNTPTRNLRPLSQETVLFGGTDVPRISRENALFVAGKEYEKKLNKILKENPVLGSSLFSEALATDFAYQFGDTGVKQFGFYKNAKDGNISSSLKFSDSWQKNEPTRCKIRQLLCKMAYRTEKEKQARKGKPATPESQSIFFMDALKDFTAEFKDNIMRREAQATVLMEQFMTLTAMQCYQNIKGSELTLDEIKEAEQVAHRLVYTHLFRSDVVLQLPNQIRPITMVSAVQNLKTKPTDEKSLNTILKDSLADEAVDRLTAYNKKNNTEHTLVVDDLMIVSPKERW